ncbi:hypothetical protein [Vibrio barjaei]|uniref:hypothetical protein n=1 Tax=Vibrio barjaei TaxID=1676683 RepID=UPI002284DE38|nr:hypothetical protein [Vibrio barjaei]MCY9874557.1 hypothetical protein [Vibrio barjaei]
MFLTQNSVELLTLPLVSTAFDGAFTIMNDLGLIAIPFLVAMFKAVTASKMQGADEGSAEVLAYKIVEVKFIWFFFVLLMFILPTSERVRLDVNFYDCGVGTTYAMHQNPDPYAMSSGVAPTVKFPLLTSIFNNVSVGFFETLTGKMYCGVDHSFYSDINRLLIVNQNKEHIPIIDAFANGCFLPAQDLISKSLEDDSSTIVDPADYQQGFFWGTNMKKAYMGLHRTPNLSPMSVEIPKSHWAGSVGMVGSGQLVVSQTDDTYNFSCDQLSDEVKMMMDVEIDTNYHDEFKIIASADSQFKRYGETRTTEVQSKAFLADQMLTNHLNPITAVNLNEFGSLKNSGYRTSASVDMMKLGTHGLRYSHYGKVLQAEKDSDLSVRDSEESNWVSKLAVYISSMSSAFTKSMSSASVYAILPVFIAVLKALLLFVGPILLLFSGFEAKGLQKYLMTLVYVYGLSYIADVSYAMSGTMNASLKTMISAAELVSNSRSVSLAIVLGTVFILTAMWTSVMTKVGATLGSFVDNLVAGPFAQPGVVGAEITKKLAELAVTRGGSIKSLGKGK